MRQSVPAREAAEAGEYPQPSKRRKPAGRAAPGPPTGLESCRPARAGLQARGRNAPPVRSPDAPSPVSAALPTTHLRCLTLFVWGACLQYGFVAVRERPASGREQPCGMAAKGPPCTA